MSGVNKFRKVKENNLEAKFFSQTCQKNTFATYFQNTPFHIFRILKHRRTLKIMLKGEN